MVFTSVTFLFLMLPAVFLLYRLIPEWCIQTKNVFLILVSLIFYAWGQPQTVLLLIFCTLMNYIVGLLIGDALERESSIGSARKRSILIFGIAANLTILGGFKYIPFVADIIEAVNGQQSFFPEIALPVGISFYTFKAISYLMEVYRGKAPAQENLISVALYISFFPHINSGPIARYDEMYQQLDSPRPLTPEKTAYGIKRFIYGMGKKVIIADQLGAFVDTVWNTADPQSIPGTWGWLLMVCYTLQIYYDFSGYSDMAVGLGEMLGFEVLENFDLPYLSRSLREFWRRWHMSLNRWFQNYLYIPLGGSRRGSCRTVLNLLIVFFLTGLWHGAGLNFIAWGLWHGIFMLLERTSWGAWLDRPKHRVFSHIYTMLVVSFGWVMFRAPSMSNALTLFQSMFTLSDGVTTLPLSFYFDKVTLLVAAAAVLFCGPAQALFPKLRDRVLDKTHTGPIQIAVLTVILLLSLMMIISGTYSSFIYFKF